MSSKSNEELIKILLQERHKLLAQHPELVPLQKEIDRVLDAAGGDPYERAEKAFAMLLDQLQSEFYLALKDLEYLESLFKKKK